MYCAAGARAVVTHCARAPFGIMASICCVRLLSLCALYAECALLFFCIKLEFLRMFEFCSFGSSEVSLFIATSQPRNCVRYQFSSACYTDQPMLYL